MTKPKRYLFAVITCILIGIFSIMTLEFLARLLLRESPYLPKRKIQAIQNYVAPHPRLGFLWKRNILYSDNVLLPWNDQVVTPLSTDSNGFRNHPKAISLPEEKRHINIIGLGDSFMHDAAYLFHELFLEHGFFYYNMAMPRHCPPQYNLVLRDYVISLKPDWIIYSIYKNDFSETIDFENWKESGHDWFTYHSGSWAGPAIDKSGTGLELFLSRYLKGCHAFYRTIRYKYLNLRERIFSHKQNQGAVSEDYLKQMERVRFYIIQAHRIARSNNIKFLLLPIPDKATMISRNYNRKIFYDKFLKFVQDLDPDIQILELYEKFDEVPEVQTLYYKIDSHWNANGIKTAAEAILGIVRQDKTCFAPCP